jgi:predicted transposase/invertase (TIGR01784 family)
LTELARAHDKFFKALMSFPQAAAALLRERLPPALAELLADGPPEILDSVFVNEELQELFSDRLFRLRLRDGTPLLVYCLIEHKSTADPRVALQLLRYLARIWDRAERAGDPAGPLPYVVPLVVYHGAEPWNVPSAFLGLFARAPPLGFRPLDFELLVVDVGAIPDDALSRDPTLRAGLLELKYATRAAREEVALGAILEALKAVPWMLTEGWLYIIGAFGPIDRAHLLGEVRRVMPEYEEKLMSIAAQEWKAEWKEQGRVEGLAEGQAMALMRILERRFGPASGAVRARIATAAPGEILLWLDRSIDAASMEEVFTAAH